MSEDLSASLNELSGDDYKVVDLSGELDEIGIAPMSVLIDPILADNKVKKVILNLEKLTFINSKGIGYLVSVHTHLAKDGRVLVLTAASEPVMDVIGLVGLTTIITYHSTLKASLA